MGHAQLVLACLALSAARAAPAQAPETRARLQLVAQISAQGVRDTATLRALRTVPRHEFVPDNLRANAYADLPLPIGYGQTISQPYIVAYMTELLDLSRRSRVLEIGTGSGYQAAVLAEIAGEVYTMEIVPPLASGAAARLRRLGFGRIRIRNADGFYGWPEAAPFDAIIVTAAAGFVPPALVDQLRPGGTMVIPIGSVYGAQSLVVIHKAGDGAVTTRTDLPVRFVPLTGGHEP